MTNNRLHRVNSVDDNLCSLCKHDVETVKHLLGQIFKNGGIKLRAIKLT